MGQQGRGIDMEKKEGRNALKSMRRGEEEEKAWKKEMGQKGSGNERKVERREKWSKKE